MAGVNFEEMGYNAAMELVRASDNALPKIPKSAVLNKAGVKTDAQKSDFLRGWSRAVSDDKKAQTSWDTPYSRSSEIAPKPRIGRVNAKTARAHSMTQRMRENALRLATLEKETDTGNGG